MGIQPRMPTVIHLWVKPISCNSVWIPSLHHTLMVWHKNKYLYKTKSLKQTNNNQVIIKGLTKKYNLSKHISNIHRDLRIKLRHTRSREQLLDLLILMHILMLSMNRMPRIQVPGQTKQYLEHIESKTAWTTRTCQKINWTQSDNHK